MFTKGNKYRVLPNVNHVFEIILVFYIVRIFHCTTNQVRRRKFYLKTWLTFGNTLYKFFRKLLRKQVLSIFNKKILFRKYCSDPDYKYVEEGDLCNRNLWYKSSHLSEPLLSGKNYHRCGPDFNNAVCSVNPVRCRLYYVYIIIILLCPYYSYIF